VRILSALALGCILSPSLNLGAQTSPVQTGASAYIDFTAYVRPVSGQPEPVRGMTFYLLSRSLSDIRKDVENTNTLVDLDHFIAQLGVSQELKEWMKAHRRVDLAGSDFIKQLTAGDVIDVPEFLKAYKDQNGAALHAVLPEPKYKKDEEQKYPEKYKLHLEQYRQALRSYIQRNLDTLQGIDAELRDINPYTRWIRLQSEQQRHIEQSVMQLAQTHYLVATAVTNLSGHATFDGVPAGQYWISNLDTPALAGDLRLHWDVAIPIASTKMARIELSNLNALETSEPSPR